MTESELQRRIVSWLNKQPKTFAAKIHGGPHQVAGLPDIVMCREGRFYGLEVKLPGKEKTLTPRQRSKIKKIRQAGGWSAVVTSLEDVTTLLGMGE